MIYPVRVFESKEKYLDEMNTFMINSFIPYYLDFRKNENFWVVLRETFKDIECNYLYIRYLHNKIEKNELSYKEYLKNIPEVNLIDFSYIKPKREI